MATPISAGITVTSFRNTTPSLDFARFIDPTPITVHPRLPLDTVLEIFKKVGPRVILVERQGKLCGIVTRKDVLKFQFELENRENPRSEEEVRGQRWREDKLWQMIVKTGEAIKDMLFRKPPSTRRRESYGDHRMSGSQGISDGIDLNDNEVELDDRLS